MTYRLEDIKELDPSLYDLSLNQEFESLSDLLYGGGSSMKSLSDVKSYLASVYCDSMSVDFSSVEVTSFMTSSFMHQLPLSSP